MTFTGIADLDMKILQELNDDELPQVCSVNKYAAKLCNNENFWLNRLLLNNIYTLDELKEIKGNFTYKEIYRYINFDHMLGAMEASKRDNSYLLNAIRQKASIYSFRDPLIIEAAANSSFDVLTNLFLDNLDGDSRSNWINLIYDTKNEKTIEWVFKINLDDQDSFVRYLIFANYDDYTNKQLRKYIPRLHNESGENICYLLGESLELNDLKSREEIFKILLTSKKILDIERGIELAIQGMDENLDEKKEIGWRKFLSNMKNKK